MAEEQKVSQERPAQGQATPQEEVDDLRSQLESARSEAQRYLDNWRRAEADFANYKKRVEQEREETRRFANASLIINILPVLDDLERALQSLDARLAGLTWFDGIRLIYRKLQAVLESAGVKEIPADGQPFDPRYHEAIHYAEGDEGKVLAVVQKGYTLHDRVLRPALVIVGKRLTESGGGQQGSQQAQEGTTS
ncbi:Protein GrpE [bacterium HR24]|nr:Protein GrpE [bacterium HR24]